MKLRPTAAAIPAPNLWERTLGVFAPKRARETYMTRAAFHGAGQYAGARRDKTSLKAFTPSAGSADSDTLGDLDTLRSRARDLARNTPLARGARNTSRVNVVGSGLRLKAQLQRELLGLSDEEAESWEDRVEQLFGLWAEDKLSDITEQQNFYELQGLAFLGAFDSGDIFALRRQGKGQICKLALQMIEADRVITPQDKSDAPNIREGIEQDGNGAPVAYWVRNRHPGDDLVASSYEPEAFSRIPARGPKTGERLIIHLFDRERVGQSRGVPSLAPVIEDLKQLDRYSEAELMAAVVSAFFTVFIKHGEGGNSDIVGEEGVPGLSAANEVALGSGSVVDLGPNEDIVTANPARPNANFDPFFLAIVRKIGVGLGIPYEVLIQHFSSSYSASRAALEVAWQFFMDRRVWLARNFCQPVYEWFLYEAVATGLIEAPGFFSDPVRRRAWAGAQWIGPAQISLDPVKDAEAAKAWVEMGVSTLENETINRDGGDWYRNQEQRGREVTLRRKLKLEPEEPVATATGPGRPASPKPKPKEGESK